MKRYNWFLAGVLLASIAFMAMGQSYLTHVGKDWLIEDATIRNCDITGSLGTVLGRIYYCDANHGSDAENGRSWDTATKTLAQAMLLAHTYLGSGGHATERCVIYYTNDGEAETLTTLARKTDIIGVGSSDAGKRAKILGDHTIPSTTDWAGCRFYNIQFRGTGVVAEVMHIDTQGGVEFHNCKFQGASNNTDGVKFEECQGFVVDSCIFYGSFSSAAITVVNDTDGIYECTISNNRMIGVSAIGIDWNESESYNCWIEDNYIYSVGMPIDDDGAACFVVNNMMITDIDTAVYTTGFDFNEGKAVNNIVTGSGGETDITPLPETTAN